VDFPQPLSPTKPIFYPGLMVRFSFLRIYWSVLVGYVNSTSLNSINPLKLSGYSPSLD